jgi:hypothetical protein
MPAGLFAELGESGKLFEVGLGVGNSAAGVAGWVAGVLTSCSRPNLEATLEATPIEKTRHGDANRFELACELYKT